MLITRLQKFLTLPKTETSPQTIFWFSLSLTFSFIYAFLAFQTAFTSEYVVQDDARQHVFWMVRFLDPKLFPNDLIADYFQSVAPAGYKAVYQIPALLGINPLVLNKFLPILISILTTAYCFGMSMQVLPVPAAGFLTTLLLNQNLWMKDDIISATPRAFVYPLFLGFLYYLLKRKVVGVGIAIALLGLFYPQCVFICEGILILRLIDWKNWRPNLSQNRSDWVLCAVGLGAGFIVLLPFALSASEFGPTISAAEARNLPEFQPGGRANFFHREPFKYFLTGYRSGMFPRSLFTPVTLCLGLLLTIFVKLPDVFPLVKQRTADGAILAQIVIASIAMFFAAHAVLFKLHLPSRYTGFTFRIVIALATAIAIITLLDTIFTWAIKNPLPLRQIIATLTVIIIAISTLGYPSFVDKFPRTAYRIGIAPKLYQFFQQTPKNTLIASLAEEVSNIPTFSQRSILVGSEYAIPYHVGYYRQFRQRTLELIRAQFSPNLADVKNLIQQYGIDYWLLDIGGLNADYMENNRRIRQFNPAAQTALENLQKGATPALTNVIGTCKVFEAENFIVLKADCILKQSTVNSDQ